MPDASKFLYHAFLSYNHADRRWAAELHRRLESDRTSTTTLSAATRRSAKFLTA